MLASALRMALPLRLLWLSHHNAREQLAWCLALVGVTQQQVNSEKGDLGIVLLLRVHSILWVR